MCMRVFVVVCVGVCVSVCMWVCGWVVCLCVGGGAIVTHYNIAIDNLTYPTIVVHVSVYLK